MENHFFKDVNGNVYHSLNDIPKGAVFDRLDLSFMDFTELPRILATLKVRKLKIDNCTALETLKNLPRGLEWLDSCR